MLRIILLLGLWLVLVEGLATRRCECDFHDIKDNVLEKIIITCDKKWMTTRHHICMCTGDHERINGYFDGKLDCTKSRGSKMAEVEVAERAEITGNLKCELQPNSLYEYHCKLD